MNKDVLLPGRSAEPLATRQHRSGSIVRPHLPKIARLDGEYVEYGAFNGKIVLVPPHEEGT